jgi:hypothetical protein
MALPLSKATPVLPADVIRELETAEYRPDDALQSAVRYADQIAPAIIKVVELAVEGAYLVPRQANLLFWGVHALGAARRH